MIERYALAEMAQLWTDQQRYADWVRVEVLATEAQARLGRVPADAVADIRQAPVPAAARVAELELQRDHEVLAFLAAFCETIPADSARWVHLGMTSYDLVDTALGATLARSCDLILVAGRRLRRALVTRAIEHWDTVCIGRTHGMHAEPTTFGHKLASFAFAVDRSLRRLEAARISVAVGTISGAVGTYSLIDPAVEREVCAALGLEIEPAPSQVVARDRHAELVQAVAVLGACIEQLALEFRLLQRSEVREVLEQHGVAYQGSSAMPHKRNPTTSERLCGLSRLLRGYAATILENVAMWHERDLAHSSVERVALVDSLVLSHYQTHAAAELVENLIVHGDRMLAAVLEGKGSVYSSAVLAELIEHGGMDRERAYRTVQAAAYRTDGVDSRAPAESGQFAESVAPADFRVALATAGIDPGPLTPQRFLANHRTILERLEQLRDT